MSGAALTPEAVRRWLDFDDDFSKRAGKPPRDAAPVKALALTLAQRLGAARGLPPAIVKVVRGGATGSVGDLRRQLDYLSRENDLAMKTDYGMVCDRPEYLERVIASWAADFDATRWARKTTHLVVSSPAGADRGGFERAADRFAARLLGTDTSPGIDGERWRYLVVVHADTANAHAHIVVNNLGLETGRQFDVHPARDINPQALRSLWAACAREQGFALDDTPRRARGLGPDLARTPDWRRGERGAENAYAKARAAAAVERIAEGAPAPEPERVAAERAAAIVAAERAEYRRLAATLAAEKGADPARATAAALLHNFADRMGRPWTATRAAAERIEALFARAPHASKAAVLGAARAAVFGARLRLDQGADRSRDRGHSMDQNTAERRAAASPAPAADRDPAAARATLERTLAGQNAKDAVLAAVDRDARRVFEAAGMTAGLAMAAIVHPPSAERRRLMRLRQERAVMTAKNVDRAEAGRQIDRAESEASKLYAAAEKLASEQIQAAQTRAANAAPAKTRGHDHRQDRGPDKAPKRSPPGRSPGSEPER